MIFTVYADKAEEVSKRLDKLAKKAARYNVPFSYTISDEHPETVNVFDDFGTTYLYKFADEAGNVFIWYASRPIELQERMTLKATIKAHNEWNGVKQTVLTRCKVVA